MEMNWLAWIGVISIILWTVLIVAIRRGWKIPWKWLYPEAPKLAEEEKFATLELLGDTLYNMRDALQQQLLNREILFFNAIATQKSILNKHGRKAIAIFFSVATFKEILSRTFDDTQKIPALDVLVQLQLPVAYLGELPVYVSELLTTAPVFVAGGINWVIDERTN